MADFADLKLLCGRSFSYLIFGRASKESDNLYVHQWLANLARRKIEKCVHLF